MYKKYLVTGATGFLGRAVITKLARIDAEIFALTLPNDPLAKTLPENVTPVAGDVCDKSSLTEFFDNADDTACVIHCAGIVSVASHPENKLYEVNIGGTKNVVSLCLERKVAKLVYVSSVHAIPDKPKGCVIKETREFSPELVFGDYAKSKAAATNAVLDATEKGLNASIVLPTGIIGPDDEAKGSITSMLSAYLAGKLPFAVKGGYDFVDVRDVADGIISCTEKGERGETYILSGHYSTIKQIIDVVKDVTGIRKTVTYFPLCVARTVAPMYERIALRKKKKLFYTPYAVRVLSSNGDFSNEKARTALNFQPRPVEETLKDTVEWLKTELKIPFKTKKTRNGSKNGGKNGNKVRGEG